MFVESISKGRFLFLGILQVLISMVYLPEAMPASFQAIYTPVESAGTEAQIDHESLCISWLLCVSFLGVAKMAPSCYRLPFHLLGNPTGKRMSLPSHSSKGPRAHCF